MIQGIVVVLFIIHMICYAYVVINSHRSTKKRDRLINRMVSFFKDKKKETKDITLKEDYEDVIDEIEGVIEEWRFRENL